MVTGLGGRDADAKQRVSEESLIAERRKAVFGDDADAASEPRRALAFSGGGIRSATFSLGVLQAIAEARVDDEAGPAKTFKDSQLSSFDYISTVSGGGYLGSFLCSLFIPGRLRQPADAAPQESSAKLAADDAVCALSGGIPGRIRRSANYAGDAILKAPLEWLRENGRYLTPSSSGDAMYVAALALRNWIAVHVVVGTLLMALVALVITTRAVISSYCSWFAKREEVWFLGALNAGDPFSVVAIWWSTLSVVCILPLVTIGVGLGVAYWLVEDSDDQSSRPLRLSAWWRRSAWWGRSVWWILVLGAIGVCIAHYGGQLGMVEAQLELFFYFGVECLLACFIYVIAAWVWRDQGSRAQRVALTRGVELVLVLTLALAVLALVDTLGQTLYLLVTKEGSLAVAAFSPATLVVALVWLARHFSAKGAIELPAFVKKLPLSALAGFAGVAIFVLVGALWAAFVHWLVWGGQLPDAVAIWDYTADAAWVLVATLLLAYLNGNFVGFINLSSLQAFYAARLTRAYLGATNGKRFAKNASRYALSAAEPIPGDPLKMSDYFCDDKLATLAPVHIINVTVNKTVDPAEQLVQRDRKGQPLAVLPFGIALDSDDVKPFPAYSRGGSRSIERELDVGEWVATSGAAVSTGIGRQTSLGLSLLLGAANVRLGTWWPTGHSKSDVSKSDAVRIPLMPSLKVPGWLQSLVGSAFKTQRYLSYELRAAFHGTQRRWQYLSDGGHFENTAIYELLREKRNVQRIFACDNGADPDYEFADLANLIRLAKIDFKIEIRVEDPEKIRLSALKGLFGTPDTFKNSPLESRPVALLLYAYHERREPVQIVVIKPCVGAGAPADVLQYTRTHAPFPQQPTSDQFFDEAQWESYRALGYWQGSRVFTPKVLGALDAHARSV